MTPEPALFVPDRYSAPHPAWRPVPSPVRRAVLLTLTRGWGFGPAPHATVAEAESRTANSRNWRVLPTRVVVKRLPRAAALAYSRAAEAADMLHARGRWFGLPVPVVRPLWSRSRSWTVEWDGHAWAVSRLAGGHWYRGTRADVGVAGHALAQLFRVCGRLELDDLSLECRRPLDPDEWALLEALVASDEGLRRHVEEVGARRAELRALPLRVAHIDLHPYNLLVGRRGVTVMDAASIRAAPPVAALGYAVLKLARQAVVHQRLEGRARAEPVRSLLAAVGPVEAEPLLWLAAKAELLKRLAFIESDSTHGRMGWILDRPPHRAGLAEIDVLREVSG